MSDRLLDGIERERRGLEDEIAAALAKPHFYEQRLSRLKTLMQAVRAELEHRRRLG
jgi:hypothetical protein